MTTPRPSSIRVFVRSLHLIAAGWLLGVMWIWLSQIQENVSRFGVPPEGYAVSTADRRDLSRCAHRAGGAVSGGYAPEGAGHRTTVARMASCVLVGARAEPADLGYRLPVDQRRALIVYVSPSTTVSMMNAQQEQRFLDWVSALEARHLADLEFPEVSRACGRCRRPMSSAVRGFEKGPRCRVPASARRSHSSTVRCTF